MQTIMRPECAEVHAATDGTPYWPQQVPPSPPRNIPRYVILLSSSFAPEEQAVIKAVGRGYIVRDHRKLRAFELADQLALAVYEETRSFPREEQFGLTAQMRKSSVSSPSNIVEGCARFSEADYLRFLDIAYGSTRELEYQISLATRLGFLNEAGRSRLAPLCKEAGRVLHGLIRARRSGLASPDKGQDEDLPVLPPASSLQPP